MALPREASEVSEFNDLSKGLGQGYPTGNLGVSGTTPKPSEGRRSTQGNGGWEADRNGMKGGPEGMGDLSLARR